MRAAAHMEFERSVMAKVAYLLTRPLPPHLKYRILGPISEAEFRHILDRYGVVPREGDPEPEEHPQSVQLARKCGDSACTE